MAIDFLGTDEYIDCGSGATLDNIRTLTAAVWLWRDVLAANHRVIDKINAGATVGWGLYVGTDNKLKFYQVWSTTAGDWNTGASTIAAGVWTHVGVTYNGGATTNDPIFYINGTAVAATEVGTPAGSISDDSAISANIGGLADFCDGKMEDARIFNRILTAQEVAILAGGYRGPLGGEVGWWMLDQAQNIYKWDGMVLNSTRILPDKSGNGNHGTPTNNPTGENI